MLISLLLFTLCYLSAYFLAKISYHSQDSIKCLKNNKVYKDKMPLLYILFISLLCTYYNYIVTNSSIEYGSDRLNYLISFDYGRFESLGLMILMHIVQEYGGTFNSVLYLSTFVSVFCVMLAYKYSRDAKPSSLLLFFMSPFIFQTFTALKQCYTIGFASLMIMLLLQERNVFKEIICILLIVLSCLFHPTGYLLIILYLFLHLDFRFKNVFRIFIYCFIIILFFKPIMLNIASFIPRAFPDLAKKILAYFGEDGMEAERGFIVLLKGLPYYYILYIALKYRNSIQDRIKDFDKYLLITIVGTFFYVVTIYNVWMRRVTDLLTFSIIVFWTQIVANIPKGKVRMRNEIILMLLFTYRWLIMIYINFGFF